MQILLILLGSLSLVLTMFKSGLIYSFGMGFWGANGHDGIWHLAVIESIKRGSFVNPVFAGFPFQNYHLGYDLFVALISKLTGLESIWLYFQIFPIILSLLIGFLVYQFIYTWKKSKIQAFFAVFFVYFSGSFGWLVELVRRGRFDGESIFWAQQSISTLINPPFALSIVFILLGFIELRKFIQNNKLKNLIFSVLSFGILIQIKAYAGVLVLLSLSIGGIYDYLINRKLNVFKVFLLSLIFSLLIFLPFNLKSGSLFVFSPFWFLETLVGFKDRFYWERLYLALIQAKETGITFKAIISYFLAFLIFIVGNLGTRLIGLFSIKELLNKKKGISLDVIMIFIAFFGILIPMFFIQKGTAWNTIQFFYYSLFIFSIYSGLTLAKIFEKKNLLTKILSGFILLATVPTSISTLYFHYLPKRAPAMISNQEIEALNFLSFQDEGIVLTYPYDSIKAKKAEVNPPRPLYLYESTAYVSAFAKKQLFLEDEVNLEITGYDWRERKMKILNFFEFFDKESMKEFLKENNITYIYLLNDQEMELLPEELGFEEIFSNSQVNIYKLLYSKEQ